MENNRSITIRSDYPGGNILVESIKGSKVKLKQDIRDSMSRWFYWNFCVEDAQGMEIEFEFTDGEVIGNHGPCVSFDGINRKWVGEECVYTRKTFRYRFPPNISKAFFSFSLPYQLKDLESFYDRYKGHKMLSRDILTISEKGRPVPLLHLGRCSTSGNKHIILTCRHHACESTPSYMLEGLLSYFLNKSVILQPVREDLRQVEEKRISLLDSYTIHTIPFVDLDGVEEGDQGKGRLPHDHNRDYIEKPIYKATAAIMELGLKLQPVIAIDLHAPWKWGGKHDHPYFTKLMPPVRNEIEKFGVILTKVTHRNSNNIIFEPLYSSLANSNSTTSGSATGTFEEFFRGLGANVSATLEFPYSGTADTCLTQENCRHFGANFAEVLEKYLKE